MNAIIEMLVILIGLIALFGAIILLSIGICWTCDKVQGRITTKRKAEHPELFKLFEAVHERSTMSCQWYNKEIAPRKRKVDEILKEWNYYTEKTKSEKEQELEELREAIELARVTENLIDNELQDLRQQVRDYITANEIKWANGWMD
jgi:hypothetical protein